MIPICDYHMHTPLCGHAIGEPEEYARAAVSVGLKEIGFSDHAPFIPRRLPGITMTKDELPEYHHMIEAVREKFKDRLTIKIGLEADYLPDYVDQTKAMLDAYPYDYVIGSVHFINDWGFDNPDERDTWGQSDVNQVYREYYDLLRQSAKTELFNIIGHCDLVKKFGHRADEDMSGEIEQTADVFKSSGVAIEINTSGLHKPCREMYPALSALEIYAAKGVPLTFGSDSHDPHHVGRAFEEAVEMARAAGFKDYVTFSDRKIKDRIKF